MGQYAAQNINQKFSIRENQLRFFIINEIIDEQSRFNLLEKRERAKAALQMSDAEYESCVRALQQRDGMVADEEQNVLFIYPVSALPTNHHVTLADGRSFCAMCAIDAMGAAFTFHQDSEVRSQCSVCGAPVYVRIQDGKLAEYFPEDLHALTFRLGELENWANSC